MCTAKKYVDEQKDRKSLELLYKMNKSYRQTAHDFEMMRGVKLNHAMVRLIIKGYDPGKKIRKLLNWQPMAEVASVNGTIHQGAVSLGDRQCVACGRWYISNHPRRRKCFICSPYKGQRRS